MAVTEPERRHGDPLLIDIRQFRARVLCHGCDLPWDRLPACRIWEGQAGSISHDVSTEHLLDRHSVEQLYLDGLVRPDHLFQSLFRGNSSSCENVAQPLVSG